MKIILVPAGGISAINKLSSDTLTRCKAALKLWQKGGFDKILLSGGIFLPPSIQTKPAALLMKQWLKNAGINEKYLLLEEQSRDTFENVKLSLDILNKTSNDWQITIITHWQHAIRFWITFSLGYGIKIKIHPLFYKLPLQAMFKEFLSIIYHIYDPQGVKKIPRLNREKRSKR